MDIVEGEEVVVERPVAEHEQAEGAEALNKSPRIFGRAPLKGVCYVRRQFPHSNSVLDYLVAQKDGSFTRHRH